MKLRVAVFVGLLSLFWVPQAAAGEATPWKRDEVAEHRFKLASGDKVTEYSFGANGTVLAVVGRKNGPVTGPAWQWRVEEGRLQILEGDRVIESLMLLKTEGEPLP
ncbi:MAG: hypothetical protein WC485_06955 [Opitutaceae bacterium]